MSDVQSARRQLHIVRNVREARLNLRNGIKPADLVLSAPGSLGIRLDDDLAERALNLLEAQAVRRLQQLGAYDMLGDPLNHSLTTPRVYAWRGDPAPIPPPARHTHNFYINLAYHAQAVAESLSVQMPVALLGVRTDVDPYIGKRLFALVVAQIHHNLSRGNPILYPAQTNPPPTKIVC